MITWKAAEGRQYLAESAITVRLRSVLSNWKPESCASWESRICSRQQNTWGSSALILPFCPSDSMGCTCTMTEEGLSLAIRLVLKGTLALQFSETTTQRKTASSLSHWATVEDHSLISFFQWGLFCFVLFISLCDFIKIHLCINSELPVTRCPGQPKSIHVATAWMRLCRHDQHNEGKAAHTLERNWNTAVRITTHSCFIKSNASYFWSKLSTAFIEEADLCMQQRNHFQRNQGNEVGWQAGFVASLGFKTQIFHAQFLQFLIWK